MNARCLAGSALAAALRDSRQRLWSLVDDLDESQWHIQRQAGVNPIAWDLGHVAWFAEFWTQRGPHRVGSDGFVHAERPARITGPDETFDSARLPHAQRWELPRVERAELATRLEVQLADTIARMPTDDSDAALYFHRLALLHEDMHAEAFCWLRATLGYPAPQWAELRSLAGGGAVHLDRATQLLGYPSDEVGFAFDNEQPATRVALEPFEIDRCCVTAGEFCRFVDAAGYDDPDHWPGEAGHWRRQAARSHPARWRRTASSGGWEHRWFDRWLPIDPNQPVVHINAYEAQAYCHWIGRRLPTVAEWEHAAASLPADEFDWGHSVWEWTASAFLPYPGFVAGPYKDYSAPWFGDHRELRGSAFATHPRLHDRRYRNFFRPERCDIFAGFRTAL